MDHNGEQFNQNANSSGGPAATAPTSFSYPNYPAPSYPNQLNSSSAATPLNSLAAPAQSGISNTPAQSGTSTQPGTSAQKKDHSGLIKTACLVFTSLAAVTFLGLFIYTYIQWNNAKTDVKGQVSLAVSEAENKLRTELETDFNNREKYPYRTFAGPSDFGALTFEYPKTWSVYVPNDASKAQDFHAYFNPGLVNVVENKTVMALRVSILNTLTDQVKERYSNKIKTGKMTVSSKVVNKVNVDVYKGQLDSNYNGIVCIFKIRDKTVVIQTDAYLFEPDFNRILETVRFNS